MTDLLSRKIYRRNALRINFQKTLEETRGCISDTRATQAKYLGLQSNINRLCKSQNQTDDKILAIFKPENIESEVSESMSIMEPVHEILAEITLKLENLMRLKDPEQRFGRGDNKILNTNLPKLEFSKEIP